MCMKMATLVITAAGLTTASAEAGCHGAVASTTQTGPRANVIGCPDTVVNVVPPSASGRDQRTSLARPLRSTSPVPVLSAYGGRVPASRTARS